MRRGKENEMHRVKTSFMGFQNLSRIKESLSLILRMYP